MENKVNSKKMKGERKLSTVLFIGISGFTASLEKLRPTEAASVTESLTELLREIVDEYEGTIGRIIGDCVTIVFGVPITHEDDPERAVYTALDFMSAMKRFNEQQGNNILTHIGIDSGMVTVSGIDSGKGYTILGDAANRAKQLMERAKDEILVSKPVYKNVAYLFEIKALKPSSKEDKAEGVITYRIIGMKEVPGHKRGMLELYSPLIGRDKEFNLMKKTLDIVKDKKSVVILVSGEAGVGKSRLIEEFKRITVEKVNWLSGRCPSYGKGFPFWVFLEQIRSYLGVCDFDLELELKKKLGGKTEDLFKERKNEYFPYLCVFLSIKLLEHLQEKVKYLDPESLRLQEFVSVKALFRDIAKNKPLILYFEDMQWIDSESLELLKFLIDGLKNVPVFFIFETRPEKETGLFKVKDSLRKKFKKRYTEIRLKPFRADEAKKLIQNLLKADKPPRDVSSLILEKSEGNPFYIVEIVRTFIELGILKRDSGSWKFTKAISSFEVPDTVEAVIRSRIDQLPLEAQEILGSASVIGKSFLYKILSSISEEGNLRKNLGFLEDREFILKRTDGSTASRLSPNTEFMFRHVLIRDVAYKGLERERKQKIHKKTAECIENIVGEKIEDYYEMLAYHYYNAQIYEKSYEYYKMAGDRAKKLYRNNVAIECYAEAIGIHKKLFSEDGKENLAELFEKQGDVREIKAEYDKAMMNYETALSYYTDLERKAEIKRKIGTIFRGKSEYNSAISCYEEVIQMLKNVPESPVLLATLISYANLYYESRSDYERAEKMAKHAIKKLDKKEEKGIHALGLRNLGNIFLLKGDYDKALKYFKKTLVIDDQINDKKGIGMTSGNIGIVYWYKGKLDTALKYYKKHLTISEEIGDKRGTGKVSCNLGLVYKDKGELDTALNYYRKYLAISEEIGDKSGIGVASNNIGDVYYDKGELDTALKYYKRDYAISEESGDKSGIGVASNNIGLVYHNKGELDTAMNYYKRYLAVSKEIGYRTGIGDASGNIGVVYYDKGKLDTAMKYYKKSLSIFEEIGFKRGTGFSSCLLGELYTAIKRFDNAREHLERSEEILKEIGDRINLSRVYASLSNLNTLENNYGSALEFSQKALELAKQTGAREKEVIALRIFGKALSKESSEKAVLYLKHSISLAKKQEMRFHLGKSLYELAKILKDTGKIRETKKHLKKAKTIFTKSGANGWLEKVEELKKGIEKTQKLS